MNVLNGRDFYEWAEWRDLCARLGINLDVDCITKIVICAPVIGFVALEITRHLQAQNAAKDVDGLAKSASKFVE